MARKALLVGINRYPNPADRLNGCINDVEQMERLLVEHFDFDSRGITVLRDEAATTTSIRLGLARLADARNGDVLVFHYSGHGSQLPDRDGDETIDNLDEVLCPWDMSSEDPLTDDDLYAAVQMLPAGAHLAVVLDCCHSGTALRGCDTRRRRKCLPPPAVRNPAANIRRFGYRAAEAGAVLLAGCRADQSSADAFIDGAYHGAHTYFLCRALEASGYRTTYRALVRSLRHDLKRSGFDQVPQLEGPRHLLAGDVLQRSSQLVGTADLALTPPIL